jgi:hypothetical protein
MFCNHKINFIKTSFFLIFFSTIIKPIYYYFVYAAKLIFKSASKYFETSKTSLNLFFSSLCFILKVHQGKEMKKNIGKKQEERNKLVHLFWFLFDIFSTESTRGACRGPHLPLLYL